MWRILTVTRSRAVSDKDRTQKLWKKLLHFFYQWSVVCNVWSDFFFFWKSGIMKHPNINIYINTLRKMKNCNMSSFCLYQKAISWHSNYPVFVWKNNEVGYTKVCNNRQPSATTQNFPQPSTTTHNYSRISTATHNHSQPSTTTHNHPKLSSHLQPSPTILNYP